MGRNLSNTVSMGSAIGLTGLSALPLYPGQLPLFGSGQVEIVLASANFVVPVTGQYRIRVMAGGADPNTAGQASSFGILLSATGGAASAGVNGGAGGTGLGGDFQASGGQGGTAAGHGGGGGAAGTQLGDGGVGGNGHTFTVGQANWHRGGGGGGVAGHRGGTGTGSDINLCSGGGGPLGHADGVRPGLHWLGHADQAPGLAMVDALAPSTFQFVGGYAAVGTDATGLAGQGGRGALAWSNGGSSGDKRGGIGGVGAGGGGTNGTNLDMVLPSLMGGGAGGYQARGGGGGGGFAMGVFNLTAGETHAVTVAQIIAGTKTSPGIVIIEW